MLRSDHSAFSTGSPFTRLTLLALYLAGAMLALGCKPQIGDECTVSTNCSISGDRLCDITQPGGYCTVFNCSAGTCPADSLCLNFGTSLSPVDGCATSSGTSPYQRSFCMATCSSNGDCRGGYACKSAGQLGAVLAETSRSGSVCAVEPKGAPTDNSNEVCLGSDAGPPVAGGAGSAGASASAGSGGVGGEAGAAGEGGAGG